MVQSKTELFDKELAEKANLFKALAHPARLRILQFLSETQSCITGDISDELPLERTTVNQHLKELKNVGLIQGYHTSDSVMKYIKDDWDYMITVCGGANENYPAFPGNVKHRLHIGFDDPSHAIGTDEFIYSEFICVRNEIAAAFRKLYDNNILPDLKNISAKK